MKLIWQKTGDYINCVPIDYSFVEFWLDNQNNFVWNTTSCLPQQELITELSLLIDKVHINLRKLKISLINTPADFVCQSTLNTIHRNWVQLHLNYPTISNLFGDEFKRDMERINKALHELEETWTLRLTNENNPLSITTLPNYFGQANVKIPYENLGRSSYNKWINFDESLDTPDTNDFDEIYNILSINLNRSFISQPPNDYVNWALSKGAPPKPNTLLLANFIDLENKQDTYRSLFMKNFVLSNNDVIFTQ